QTRAVAIDAHAVQHRTKRSLSHPEAGENRSAYYDNGEKRAFQADGQTRDYRRGRTSLTRAGDALHRSITRFRVILGNPDKEEARYDSDDSASEKPQVSPWRFRRAKQEETSQEETHKGQDGRVHISAVQRFHGIFIALQFYGPGTHDACQQTNATSDQRKEDAFDTKNRDKRDPENHRADIFSGNRFKQVCAAPRTVAHVVAHQVGNNGRVPRIIFRDPRF